MTYENFTIKSQDAILRAQQIAQNLDQQVVDSLHLCKGVIEVDESLCDFLFQKMSAKLPKVNLSWMQKSENYQKSPVQTNNTSPMRPTRS
ncbi:MAG: hypothetical protein IPI90_15815 [Saprospiraceae bacterium]|nr:hypothetical protein [Candidatus Vicinibacter affinis]